MTCIYLSPHLDDAALSCGGLIWQQTQAGEKVQIWTVCAGDPPPGEFSPFARSLHARWDAGARAVALRRKEDEIACQRLGASWLHMHVPDCIYRRTNGEFLYASEEALFGELHSAEQPLVEDLAAWFSMHLPANASIICPLALGNHIDHQLVRRATEASQHALSYYPDFPYVLAGFRQRAGLEEKKLLERLSPLPQAAVEAWADAVAAYASQISTFWRDEAEMRQAIASYAAGWG